MTDLLSRKEIVEYLRKENYDDEIIGIIDNFPPAEAVVNERNAAIDECAKIAFPWSEGFFHLDKCDPTDMTHLKIRLKIVARIRALKTQTYQQAVERAIEYPAKPILEQLAIDKKLR